MKKPITRKASKAQSKTKQIKKQEKYQKQQEEQQEVVQKKIKAVKSRSRTKSLKSQQPLKSQSSQNQIKQQKPIKKAKKSLQKQGNYKHNNSHHHFKLDCSAGTYSLQLHQNYTINQSHKLYSTIQKLFRLYLQKQEKKEHNLHKTTHFSYFPAFQWQLKEEDPAQNKCSICQFEYEQVEDCEAELLTDSDEDLVVLNCGHMLHINCLRMLSKGQLWLKCPVCSTIYGKMVGDQPEGSMTYNTSAHMHCEGHEKVGTITINYSMKAGKRGAISYPSTHRTAYLPDSPQGNEVLKLLKESFDRKLIFTIGRSVTTGRDNQIVWNGIHHKTNLQGGSAYFGYPDDTYFERVKMEMAAKGVTEDSDSDRQEQQQ